MRTNVNEIIITYYIAKQNVYLFAFSIFTPQIFKFPYVLDKRRIMKYFYLIVYFVHVIMQIKNCKQTNYK